jgi:hypothetical protein
MARNGIVVAAAIGVNAFRVSQDPLPYRTLFDLQTNIGRIAPAPSPELTATSSDGAVAKPEPRGLATVDFDRVMQFRYTATYRCPGSEGYFVAQINWDVGRAYYRLVSCANVATTFVDVVPAPVGASKGFVYITARDTTSIEVSSLTVEAL